MAQETDLMRALERQCNAINYGSTEIATNGLQVVALEKIADSATAYYNIIKVSKNDVPDILLPFLRLFYVTENKTITEDGEEMLFGSLVKFIHDDMRTYKKMATKLNQDKTSLENKLKTFFDAPEADYFLQKIEFLRRNCGNAPGNVQDSLDNYIPEITLYYTYFQQLEYKCLNLTDNINYLIIAAQNLNNHIVIDDELASLINLGTRMDETIELTREYQKTLNSFIHRLEIIENNLNTIAFEDENTDDFDAATMNLCISRMTNKGIKDAQRVLEMYGHELLCAIEDELAADENACFNKVYGLIDTFIHQYKEGQKIHLPSTPCNDSVTSHGSVKTVTSAAEPVVEPAPQVERPVCLRY